MDKFPTLPDFFPQPVPQRGDYPDNGLGSAQYINALAEYVEAGGQVPEEIRKMLFEPVKWTNTCVTYGA